MDPPRPAAPQACRHVRRREASLRIAAQPAHVDTTRARRSNKDRSAGQPVGERHESCRAQGNDDAQSNSGQRHVARLVQRDPKTDLAVLHIEAPAERLRPIAKRTRNAKELP